MAAIERNFYQKELRSQSSGARMASVRVADESGFKAPTFKYGAIEMRSIVSETPVNILWGILTPEF